MQYYSKEISLGSLTVQTDPELKATIAHAIPADITVSSHTGFLFDWPRVDHIYSEFLELYRIQPYT